MINRKASKTQDIERLVDLLIKQLEIGQAAAQRGYDELMAVRQENARLKAENDQLMQGISQIQGHRADEHDSSAKLREALWSIMNIAYNDPNNWAEKFNMAYDIAMLALSAYERENE